MCILNLHLLLILSLVKDYLRSHLNQLYFNYRQNRCRQNSAPFSGKNCSKIIEDNTVKVYIF